MEGGLQSALLQKPLIPPDFFNNLHSCENSPEGGLKSPLQEICIATWRIAGIGKLKSIIAKKSLEHLNSLADLDIYNLKCDRSNALRILEKYDIIVDATDNFDARYVINDACVILGKPMVHGAIYKYEGAISVFNYKGGPTYRCYYPQTNDMTFKNPVPSSVGLLGVLPGITGTYLANEVIKIITEAGEVLSGKVLLINIFNNTFRTYNVKNVPENHHIKAI